MLRVSLHASGSGEEGRVRLIQGKQKIEMGLGGSGRSSYLYSSRGRSWSGSS